MTSPDKPDRPVPEYLIAAANEVQAANAEELAGAELLYRTFAESTGQLAAGLGSSIPRFEELPVALRFAWLQSWRKAHAAPNPGRFVRES